MECQWHFFVTPYVVAEDEKKLWCVNPPVGETSPFPFFLPPPLPPFCSNRGRVCRTRRKVPPLGASQH